MNTFPSKLLLAAAVAAATPTAYAAESIAEAFQNGSTAVSFRLRFEDVDVGGVSNDALTLKSRLTYKTDTLNGFSALFEVDDTTVFGDEDYTGIADSEYTDVNQAYLAYSAADTTVKFGRQRILLDNQRFVGGVGFRQNEQTYDALTLTNKSLPDTTLFYGYISEVNNIFASDAKHETHLLNAKYTGLPFGTVTGYYYQIEPDAAADSIDTFGVRFTGSQPAGDAKLLYTAEYATQDQNNGSKPDYYVLEGGVSVSGVTAKLGFEVLESDNGVGFNTPLATKHKFQGWADKFLGTPGTGIEDLYLTVGTKVAGVKLLAVYHDFEAESTSADLGSEFGLVVAKKFGKNYGLSLKYADYQAGDTGVDTDKLWLTATAKF
ncbi:alginate export family protein [Neptuniibacter sp.]|uniref:alginate export family protein n=1 Tax=Neptuniibacter sp. TaxID=1962643 RepID=UPI003B5CA6B0